MKKLINDPSKFVNESVEGILLAYSDELRSGSEDNRALLRSDAPVKGKVAIVTGGGSGHLPVFLGYVGKGLADAVAVGNVFASPSSEQILAATTASHGGAGVLYLFGNYMGDTMNFEMAGEMAEVEGIQTEIVRVSDDIASAGPEEWQRRRGIAGLFYAYKIAGACAETGVDLPEVKQLAEKVVANVRSIGVALGPCILPETGKPTFTIGEDEMEIGMGIHGEPGVDRGPLQSADDVAETLVNRILADFPDLRNGDVSVLINGLGATPLEELYILYRKVHQILEGEGITIYRRYIGEFATSMEMSGASVTLLKLDDELKRYLDAPAKSPFFEQTL